MQRAKLAVMIITVVMCSVAANGAAQSRTVADRALKVEISKVDGQIAEAEAENAHYSGGLMKSLVESRLAILKQTRALLGHRATARNSTAPSVLRAVEAELEANKRQIAQAEGEVAAYSGALRYSLSLGTLASLRQSQAMLEQKRLSLKYGFPLPPSPQLSTNEIASDPEAVEAPLEALLDAPLENDWNLVSVESRVTEQNLIWWKISWKLTVHNWRASQRAFRATIEFQDKDGFIIDTSFSDAFVIQPYAFDTASGYGLIRTTGAEQVAKTVAKVRLDSLLETDEQEAAEVLRR
jgi:hypothetical protein